MKPLQFTSLAVALASLALSSAHAATTIFTDTFDSGTGAWQRASSASGAGTLSNASGQLSWARSGDANREIIGRSFDTQTLANGETLRLTFDVTQSTATSFSIFRVGLFNVTTAITADNWAATSGAYTGYSTFVRDNLATGNPAREESSTGGPTIPSASPSAIEIGSTTTQYDIAQSTVYQGIFEITRTSATQVDTLFTLLEGATTRFSIAGVDTTTPYTSFDTAVLRISGGTALFDNITLEVIPEPSTAILGGLGLLALLRRRR